MGLEAGHSASSCIKGNHTPLDLLGRNVPAGSPITAPGSEIQSSSRMSNQCLG